MQGQSPRPGPLPSPLPYFLFREKRKQQSSCECPLWGGEWSSCKLPAANASYGKIWAQELRVPPPPKPAPASFPLGDPFLGQPTWGLLAAGACLPSMQGQAVGAPCSGCPYHNRLMEGHGQECQSLRPVPSCPHSPTAGKDMATPPWPESKGKHPDPAALHAGSAQHTQLGGRMAETPVLGHLVPAQWLLWGPGMVALTAEHTTLAPALFQQVST